ncbi:MAG: GNAT family N-acetyltransferase [Tannerella sp.]|jgi:GNAT superfamily N-acetyltransferase|nr:GNAT family N-acetyltransferase [Tannerella sp.]
MIFRPALLSDLPSMMDIVRQAQEALKQSGVNQWQNGYPAPDMIRRDIENKHAYVLIEDDRIVAMESIIFNYEPAYDRIYDGEWLSKGTFAVVHRMAVDNRMKKRGIASFLLKKAEEMAVEKGIISVKVDTHESNVPMRRTLEKNGFTCCGRIFLADGNPRVAYEKLPG